jgi:signal transduction histidine kinase
MTSRVLEHVAIIGDGPEAERWAEILAHRGVTVARLDEAAASQADLVVQLEAAESSPPAVVLRGARDHPLTRLLRSLLQAKQDWEEAFDAVVDPVAILDADGTITRGNVRLASLLEVPVEAIPALPYLRLFGDPVGVDPVGESLADGQARTREARYTHIQGHHLVTTSPRRTGRGGLVVSFKDVTQLHEHERLLQQASRLADIGQLAAGVAHEINTPLASIALRAESLLRAAEDPRLRGIDAFQSFPRYLKTIDEEVYRCKKIIGALLEFSRSRKPEVRETDLNALAETAAELVRHPMHLKQVELSLALEPGLRTIRADDGQLRQVLLALLLNALDATPKGGHVRLETRAGEAEGRIVFSVADDGEGIAKEHLDKIFTPFFTTKAVGKGTGLGLAICHGIVQAHGGEIAIDSQVGRGTRVTVALPIVPRAPSVA